MPKKPKRVFVKTQRKGGTRKSIQIPADRTKTALEISRTWMQKAKETGGNPANLGQALVLCNVESKNALKIFVKFFANKEGDSGASGKATNAMNTQYFPFRVFLERKKNRQ
ncbi:MAG: hypothetical protein COT90_05365 [Candidatus Diapherotrites archaeon CG10_big_fil_rev_8_21_14_0_10_31_34]|nr:MAG: hypothetical protein COT90_05365 [Candidatus Diapherotrites archaeon CG10_big_fil_rev_8_21_14_0_10_31_34]PJA18549.1 MAG: hypothetical protein COX63_02145 [Candidatus Diapherotrites archaeon CG_4_10_14_0_2_um_filter_31_5]